ncbi:MAG TPA: VWA domain-containing protein [Methanothrix soehngenii]|jgi:Ca-activated chloride channel family protein|uniref:vWA domain-containing protein n=1 Tax=Methanothrix soehngenii TaxID=2223 RepID=UPI002B5B1A7E|nr:VWA domain-containing protein [Methanothrix soehngenii]HOI19431.1 VWA domain-containing protein [Methanothrix soehngenii]
MLDKKNKNVLLKIVGLAVAVFLLVYIGTIFMGGGGEKTLDGIVKEIDVTEVPPTKGLVDISGIDIAATLPDISKYPPQVNSSTSSYIEIFSSTEKAGGGTDGWLTEVARDFNNAKIMIDGKQTSVRLRGIASGQGADYITSGKYLPDAYTPSNELWGEMLISRGVDARLVQKRLAGNAAGILITKSKKAELEAKYGAVNVTTVIDSVANNELQMGYTNPFASSTGLNFLISTLQAIDASNPLSNKAIAGFDRFQENIPVVAYTTLQMREAAKSGVLDAFVLEYQTYVNTPDIRSYEFIPFGVRHDSPIYAIGKLSPEKTKILDEFIKFSQQENYQNLATKYGFNGLDEYRSEFVPASGDVLIQAQKLWKEKKNANICAVFVADVSGSMDGEPLNNLKKSLLEGQKYIGKDNLIGLVSYSDDVYINLPISLFDLNNRSYFVGAVGGLQAGGATATFDGIAVAMKMLEEQLALDPKLKPKIFVLSDGETNRGHSLNDIRKLVEESGIPIYTIGYNADIKALEEISLVNEAASINADTEDVVYKLANLFNAELA